MAEEVRILFKSFVQSRINRTFSQKSIQGAAYRFAEKLDKDDRVSIITFSSKVRLILDWTNDLNRVRTKLKSIWAKGKTVLNDAVYVTYDDLFKDLPGKKAIILLTDGVDVGSLVGFEDVLNLAERSEATVYVVSLLQEYRHMAEEVRIERRARLLPIPLSLQEDYIRRSGRFLTRLSRNTGGRIFNAASATELSDIYEEVAQEIKNPRAGQHFEDLSDHRGGEMGDTREFAGTVVQLVATDECRQ